MKTAVASIQEKANKLGPPERARAETGGDDQWVFKRRECEGFARVNQVTSASLRYPLSVFNKNSTLKLGPPERARAETGGDDQWVLKRREC